MWNSGRAYHALWMDTALVHGTRAGLALLGAYMGVSWIGLVIYGSVNRGGAVRGGELLLIVAASLLMAALGFVVAMGPVLGLAIVTASMIGLALPWPHIAPYPYQRLAVGAGIGVVSVSAIYEIAQSTACFGATVHTVWFCLYFIGAPSLIYLAACAWLSLRLPDFVKASQSVAESPVQERVSWTERWHELQNARR